MTNTLYLKYRPQKIGELDLTEVREQLTKIVKSGKIPHAFLFAGPRGAGKTSAARIIAKAVNCERRKGVEPCNKCSQCTAINKGSSLDIIEIDAASHRGVDDVRSLREAIKLSPAGAKKKVYIVDEAHMLTPEAANALLKTLEEPPEHAMFVLATTAPEKLPDTVRSRCTLLIFRKAQEEEIVRSLERIVKGEKLKLEKGVLDKLAGNVDGSFREAHKLLEQLSLGKKKVTLADTGKLVTLTSVDPGVLLSLLAVKNAKGALAEVDRVVKSGANLKVYTTAILRSLREMLLEKIEEGGDTEDLKSLIELFSEATGRLATAVIPQLPLELAVVRWCENKSQKSKVTLEESRSSQNAHGQTPAPGELGEKWREIMRRVKPRNHSIEALLRATRAAEFDGKVLRVEVFYEFHKERLERDQYRKVVEEIASEVLGSSVRIICILSTQKQRAADITNIDEEVEEDIVRAAEEIFGGVDELSAN